MTVESCGSALVPGAGLAELLLDPMPLGQDSLQALLAGPPLPGRSRAPLLDLRQTILGIGQLAGDEPLPQPFDLDAELLGPRRGRRLEARAA